MGRVCPALGDPRRMTVAEFYRFLPECSKVEAVLNGCERR